MTATAARVTTAPEQRIILPSVSWSTFEGLVADHFERNSPRFTYDRGRLELMVTSREHEELNRTLTFLVEIVALEPGIDFWNLGHATHKREDLEQGFDPDTCFFFHTRPRILRTVEFDPAMDLPPDLVLEVDLSSDSLSRFPIYARFGVPEVWRYRLGRIQIWQLEFGYYSQVEVSQVLPPVTGEMLTRFLEESPSRTRVEWVRSIQSWICEHVTTRPGS